MENAIKVCRNVDTLSKKEQPMISTNDQQHIEDHGSDGNDSEYDSAGSYSEEEEGKVRYRTSDQDSQVHSDFEEDNGILQRESGDGQESIPTKKVDDDEDKKNPQYIPKRGTFYEHDDRTAEDPETIEITETEKPEKDIKKKVWEDKKEKWSHDRFCDTEQQPKSRTELISIYGYDIRNEDGPPKARRRRRYGRGPNKYTRKWEDEDAYVKPAASRPRRPQKNRENAEEFPPLGGNRNRSRDNKNRNQDEIQPGSSKPPNHIPVERSEPASPEPNDIPSSPEKPASLPREPPQQNLPPPQPENKPQMQRAGSGRVVKPQKEIKDSDYRGFTTKTRQYRNVKTEQKVLPRVQKKDDFIKTQNFTNRSVSENSMQELERDISKMNMQDGGHKGKHNGNRQGSVPPRLQTEQKGSKRYSSIRQRSLPEAANPPFTQQHSTYYPNESGTSPRSALQMGRKAAGPESISPYRKARVRQNLRDSEMKHYVQQAQPPQQAPQPLLQSAPIPHVIPGPMQMAPQQVPVTATPLLQAPPPPYGAPPPPFPQGPPAFLQAGVAPPPPFLPQQQPPPQIINYVPSQPPPPQFTQAFTGYQQQFTPVVSQSLGLIEAQPAELYQPQGGITYYSADQQLIQQRSVPQKRPKAAIPIVAPPSLDNNKATASEPEQYTSPPQAAHEPTVRPENYVLEETITSSSHVGEVAVSPEQ